MITLDKTLYDEIAIAILFIYDYVSRHGLTPPTLRELEDLVKTVDEITYGTVHNRIGQLIEDGLLSRRGPRVPRGTTITKQGREHLSEVRDAGKLKSIEKSLNLDKWVKGE
jgi:DNA-binding Lrp family transcriptional regulator